MSLAFPASPTVGDTYTVGARTWTWSGTIWEITGTVAAAGSIGTTPTIASSDSSATEFQSKNGREHTLPTLVKSSSLNDSNAHLLGQNQSFHGTQHL